MKKNIAIFTISTACLSYIIYKRKQREEITSSLRVLEIDSYEIVILNRAEDVETVLRRDVLRDDVGGVLGLDTEWLSRKKVALLQIATSTACYLIRMNLCYPEDRVPDSSALSQILRSGKFVKIGVNVKYDLHLLETQFSIPNPQGFVDLQIMATSMNLDKKGHRGYGLRALTCIVLDRDLPKNKEIRCGDWSDLSRREKIEYAARDAIAGYHIPIRLWQQQHTSNTTLFEFLSPYINRTTCRSRGVGRKKLISNKRQQKKKKESSFVSITGLKYQGCKLLSKDGVHLCNINEKKCRWYLKKNLAILVEEKNASGGKTIQLKFKAKGRGHAGDEFYLTEMHNRCVMCGSTTKGLINHYVVPKVFRKAFPEKYKSHSNHDIVLLCSICKKKMSDASCRRTDEILSNLREIYDVKSKDNINNDNSRALKACKALLKHEKDLPPHIKQRYIELVSRYLDISDDFLSTKTLETLHKRLTTEKMKRNRSKPDLGAIYVNKHLDSNSDLIRDFVFSWRRFFVETGDPKFLMRGWSIDRPLSGDERGD